MTLGELIAEVSSLGFDEKISCDTLFLTSLKRCLYQIFSEKKITGKTVLHKSRENIANLHHIMRYNGVDPISLPLEGSAVSFYTSGRGSYALVRGSHKHSFDFEGSSVQHAHVLNARGLKIVFSGDTPYTVSSFAVFKDSFAKDSDVPFATPMKKYDMRILTDDFLSFDAAPKDSSGKVIDCASLEDGCILVDEKFEGDIYLTYRRLPHVSMSASEDREIDIPREHEHLLPVLMASYVYLDTDKEKATHYRELYSSFVSAEEKSFTRDTRSEYIDTNGWA